MCATPNEKDGLQIDFLRNPDLIAAEEDNSLSLRSSTFVLPALEHPLAGKMKFQRRDRRGFELQRSWLSRARRTR